MPGNVGSIGSGICVQQEGERGGERGRGGQRGREGERAREALFRTSQTRPALHRQRVWWQRAVEREGERRGGGGGGGTRRSQQVKTCPTPAYLI